MGADASITRRAPSESAVLLITGLGVFVAFVDVTIVNIAFPSIRADFGEADLAELSWVLNAYNIVFAALLLPAGRIGDLLGLRRIFLIGLGTFVVGSILCGVAPSAPFLIVARVVQAAGAALVIPSSLGLLLRSFPLERRAAAVGVWGAAAAIAAATGPTLGGLIVKVADWRLVFFVNVPIGLLAILLAARRLPPGSRSDGPFPDLAGIVLAAAAMGLLSLAIVQGNAWGWGTTRTLGAFAAAAVAVALLVARSRGRPNAVVDPTLLRSAPTLVANLGTLLFAAAFYALLLCNVLCLTEVWGYSALGAGLALTPGPMLSAAVARPAGRIADRYGHWVVIVPGVISFCAAAVLFAVRVDSHPAYLADWLPSTILSGLGIGLAFPALSSAAVMSLPPERFGVGSALNATARQLGAVIGIAALVAIIQSQPAGLDAFRAGWTFIAIVGLSAAPAGLWLRHRGRAHRDVTEAKDRRVHRNYTGA
jgi:EmrB/QacA subfamily drug resistance transporter